jgi:hypothetical protein
MRLRRLAGMHFAACREEDPELFFPIGSGRPDLPRPGWPALGGRLKLTNRRDNVLLKGLGKQPARGRSRRHLAAGPREMPPDIIPAYLAERQAMRAAATRT